MVLYSARTDPNYHKRMKSLFTAACLGFKNHTALSKSNSGLNCEASDVRNNLIRLPPWATTFAPTRTVQYLSLTSECIGGYACCTQTVLKNVFHVDGFHANNNIGNIFLQSHALYNKHICIYSLRCILKWEPACQINKM